MPFDNGSHAPLLAGRYEMLRTDHSAANEKALEAAANTAGIEASTAGTRFAGSLGALSSRS